MCDFFVLKQRTAYDVRISDWSSDVCSSDLAEGNPGVGLRHVFGYRDALEAGRIRGAAEPAVEVVTEAVTGVDAAEGLPHLGVERAWERLVAGAEAQGFAQLS